VFKCSVKNQNVQIFSETVFRNCYIFEGYLYVCMYTVCVCEIYLSMSCRCNSIQKLFTFSDGTFEFIIYERIKSIKIARNLYNPFKNPSNQQNVHHTKYKAKESGHKMKYILFYIFITFQNLRIYFLITSIC
jgi:hypothetical protein